MRFQLSEDNSGITVISAGHPILGKTLVSHFRRHFLLFQCQQKKSVVSAIFSMSSNNFFSIIIFLFKGNACLSLGFAASF